MEREERNALCHPLVFATKVGARIGPSQLR